VLKISGPAFAVTGFDCALGEAVQLASSLMCGGLCREVLLVAVEERGILTQAIPSLWESRFPFEPQEMACAMVLSETRGEHGRELHLKPSAQTEPDFSLGLSHALVRNLVAGTDEPVAIPLKAQDGLNRMPGA